MGLQGLKFRVFRLLGFQGLGLGVYRVKVFGSGFRGFGLQTSQGPGFFRIESLGFGCTGFGAHCLAIWFWRLGFLVPV